jgi:hypothetical protein
MMVYVPPSGEIPEPGAMVIAETEASVTIAIQISKATLSRHMRFLENLVAAATRGEADGR